MKECSLPLESEEFLRRFCDSLVAVFALFCSFAVLISPEDRNWAPVRVVVCLAPAALAFLLQKALNRRPASRWLWILRYSTPLLFLVFYFRLTGQISPFFEKASFDPYIIKLDGLIFGDPKVSLRFQEVFPFSSLWFGELMCLSYMSYFFFMPVFGGILIAGRLLKKPGPDPVSVWYVSSVVLTYYLHYTFFFLFPVAGPAFHFEGKVALDPGFIANHILYAVVSRGDVPGGCFPSSHVAVAVLHTLIARRLGWRRLYRLCALDTSLICLSIVYTRAHYAVDAGAGILSGLLCWLLLQKVESLALRRSVGFLSKTHEISEASSQSKKLSATTEQRKEDEI